MHIEKINDNQIKCTLSQRDLLARQLDLSELAYGTEKARSLFQEMLEQAHDAFGFEADNMPLMVEAIPISKESIVLIITRIDSPDELDTRFSRFSSMSADSLLEDNEDISDGADEILDLFQSVLKKDSNESNMDTEALFSDSEEDEIEIHDLSKHLASLARSYSETADDTSKETDKLSDPAADESDQDVITAGGSQKPINLMRIYAFDSLDSLTELAQVLHPLYNGVNSLYKDESSSIYYLVVYQSHHTPADFNKTCNILSEYGQRLKGSPAREAYYVEHYRCIVSQTALQRLYLF